MEKQIVNSDDLDQANIGEGDVKVDTTPQNEEDAELQRQAAAEMGVDADIEESVTDDVEESKDEDITDEEESEYGYVKEEEKSDENKDDKTDKPKTLEDAISSLNKISEDFDKFKKETNTKLTESQSEAIRLKNENDKLKGGEIKTDETAEAKEQQKAFIDFVSSHTDVLGDSIIDDYKKYVASGNNAFIFNNPNLRNLAEAIESTNPALPFADRVDKAFKIGFADKISDTAKKQERVKTEIENQKVGKIANGGQKGTPQKSNSYTAEQIALAEQMDVELI